MAPLSAQATRVVSLNLCTDQLLILLDFDEAIAVSPLARDAALSVTAKQARDLPWVRPDAEAVLALHPDLVVAGDYGAQAALSVLRQQGVRVVQFPEPQDFAGVAKNVTAMAALLGRQAQGMAMVARMWARLASITRRDRGTALMWQAHGYSAGPGTFADTVLRAAGYRNAGTGRQLGIEAVLARPPGLLVEETAPAYPSLATDMLRHPALAALPRRAIDPAWLACPGPWSADAVAALAE